MSVATLEMRSSQAMATPTTHRLSGVEAARGIAATLVVLYHAALHLEEHVGGRIALGLPHFGHAGVDFFFVLSGFIITFVHHKDFGKPGRLAHYAKRRFTRVFPFYWIVLAYYLADFALLHRSELPGAWETLMNLFLLPHSQEPVVGGAWTLVFEITFYTIMAVTICSRRWGVAVLGAWAVIVLGGWLHPQWFSTPPLLHVLSSPFCLEFFLGIGTAYVALTRKVPASGWVLLAGVAAFLAAGVAEVMGLLNGYGAAARVAYGSCSVLIVLGLVERERSGQLQVPKAMAVIGQASYAIYLVHLVAIGIAFKFLSKAVQVGVSWNWVLWAGLSAWAVLAGILASSWLEQPSIRFVRKRLAG